MRIKHLMKLDSLMKGQELEYKILTYSQMKHARASYGTMKVPNLYPIIDPAKALVLASSASDIFAERSLRLTVAEAVSLWLLRLKRLLEDTSACTSSL